MRIWIPAALLLIFAITLAAEEPSRPADGSALSPKDVKLQPDPPVWTPKPGQITGCITPGGKVRRLHAVCRSDGREYSPTRWDWQSGKFTFADLPGNQSYDLCITTTDGRSIEGIDLSRLEAPLHRVAAARREALGLPEPTVAAFTANDVRAIRRFLVGWKDFMDTRRLLYLRGHGDEATALVELIRSRPFHGSGNAPDAGGEMVWRIELWYLRREGQAWRRVERAERLLRRFRGSLEEWRTIDVTYLPTLSVPIDRHGRCDTVDCTLPEKTDPSRGRPAESKIDLATEPHILGLGDDAANEALPQKPKEQPPAVDAGTGEAGQDGGGEESPQKEKTPPPGQGDSQADGDTSTIKSSSTGESSGRAAAPSAHRV